MIKIIILLIFLMSCTGGGGGAGGSNPTPSPSNSNNQNNELFTGIVVDGLISGAIVCIDINSDGICNATEVKTTSSSNGTFSFSKNLLPQNGLIPIIAIGGIDTATGSNFEGELKAIVDLEIEESVIINPLTDLITESFLIDDFKDKFTLIFLKNDIVNVIGIETSEITKNPMEKVTSFSKVQHIQQLKKILSKALIKLLNISSESEIANLRKMISKLLMKQISVQSAFNESNINLQELYERIQTEIRNADPNFIFPENFKTFISSQMNELQTTLSVIELTNNTSILNEIQAGIEVVSDNIVNTIESSNSSEAISIIPISENINDLYDSGVQLRLENELISNSGDDSSGGDSSGGDSSGGDSSGGDSSGDNSSTPTLTANAGADSNVLNYTFILDGSNSSDPNNLPLTYSWSIISQPSGSNVEISNTTIVNPVVYVDKAGTYIFRLTISNNTSSTSDTVTINYEPRVRYTNSISENSVTQISNHQINGSMGQYSSNFFYDTSVYTSLKTYKTNRNGIIKETINLNSGDRTEDISNYMTTKKSYRTCISSNCYIGWQHNVDKDKFYIERLNHADKSASEYVISSTDSNDNFSYIDKSYWSLQAKNDSLYLYRFLYRDKSVPTSTKLIDLEIIRLNSNFQKIWNKVYRTSSYGSTNIASYQGQVSTYLPYLTFEIINNKIFLELMAQGDRSGNEIIIIDNADGSSDNVIKYKIYDNNVPVTFQTLNMFSSNNQIYFKGFYNTHTGTQASYLHGLTLFKINSNDYNPTDTKAIYSNDNELLFHSNSNFNQGNAFDLTIINKTTATADSTKTGLLEMDDLTPLKVTIFDDQNDQYGYMGNVKSFINTNWLLKINNDHNFVTPTYTDMFDTKTHSLSLYPSINEQFLTVKYGSNYTARSVIEVDNNGLHDGCFETSNYSGSYEIDFNTLTWETRKETYTPPVTSTRSVNITSNQRTPTVSPIEIRAPWLCSSHAINIDKTIKVSAGSTVVSHSESEGYYRYTIHTQPQKGSVEILQPSSLSTIGNVIVRYTASSNASGSDSYKLTANDGTGTKVITVNVELQN